jgi:hypothetical protein
MRVSSFFSVILAGIGGILLLIALLSAGLSMVAFMERLQHGRGILFADVEFLGLMAIICALPGGLAVLGAKNLSKSKRVDLP